MSHKPFNFRMRDGSRHFAEFPETVYFDELREIAERLEGANVTGFLTDRITEVWLDFEFRRHQFSINNQFGNYWFFVEKPDCPDEVLLAVAEHFQKFLGR